MGPRSHKDDAVGREGTDRMFRGTGGVLFFLGGRKEGRKDIWWNKNIHVSLMLMFIEMGICGCDRLEIKNSRSFCQQMVLYSLSIVYKLYIQCIYTYNTSNWLVFIIIYPCTVSTWNLPKFSRMFPYHHMRLVFLSRHLLEVKVPSILMIYLYGASTPNLDKY